MRIEQHLDCRVIYEVVEPEPNRWMDPVKYYLIVEWLDDKGQRMRFVVGSYERPYWESVGTPELYDETIKKAIHGIRYNMWDGFGRWLGQQFHNNVIGVWRGKNVP